MTVPCHQLNARSDFCYAVAKRLIMALVLAGIAWANGQAQQAPKEKPVRLFTIYGQVSLPDGRPAVRARVKLLTRAGVPREAFTNDQGRVEFTGMEAGLYSLTASSLADPNLVSEAVEADTNRTATGNLSVHLNLREGSDTSKNTRPGVIAVAETEQNVPKEARKAFNQGVKFKKDDEREKALESFSRSIELYPEYFQALSERGDLYVLQRKLSEAAADFDRALKINARYGPALRGAGYCKLEAREFVQSAENFERAISAEPDNGNTYLLLGIVNLELDRREPAKQALQKALSLHAFRAHIYLGNLYAREHLYQQAADELHAYLEEEPMAADAANLRQIETQWRSRLTVP
jgi:tetratricopeptide (TPR) repeat protein